VQAQLKERSQALSTAREELGLLARPMKTLALFGSACSDFLLTTAWSAASSRPMLFVGWPVVVAGVATRYLMEDLYAMPGCGKGAASGGALYMPSLYLYEFLWWLVLGILSSIGFGTGLHSGIMFLWPFVMQLVVRAEAQESANIYALYNHPCAFELYGEKGDGSLGFVAQLLLLWPAVLTWGAGTAIGELPPYFITRTAKRAGRTDEQFESELEEAKAKTDIVSKLKVWTISFTDRHGFFGILLLASWPNAAFDMCGMACGWLEMPFWTFFGATLIGKSLIKTTMQSAVCISIFSPHFFAAVTALLEALPLFGLRAAEIARGGRKKIMYKFALQARVTAETLLGGQAQLASVDIARKYCEVQSRCGAPYKGGFKDNAAFDEMKTIAERIVLQLDSSGDGNLDAAELSLAQSTTDGKLSLASLDPGSGGILSFGNLWNVFLVALILFFVVSIVDQLAKAEQADRDSREMAALEAKLLAEASSGAATRKLPLKPTKAA